jgi:hypothetical protein
VKRHHDQGKHLIGAGLQFRGSAHYQQGRKHSSIQAHMLLEELGVLHLHPKEARSRLTSRQLGGGSLKAHPHSDTLPPTRPRLLIVPLPGPFVFKPPQTLSQRISNMCTCFASGYYPLIRVSLLIFFSDPEHLKKELDELVGAIEEHFFQPQKYNLQPKAE